MSYILDALRRADAERERGSVPDLRAQPLGAASSQEVPRAPPWPWIAALLAALLIGALAWYLAAPDEPPIALPPNVAALPAAPAPATAAAHARPAEPSSASRPSVTVVATAPPRAASAAAKPEAGAASAGERIVAQADLPPDIRRQLPALAIGGSMGYFDSLVEVGFLVLEDRHLPHARVAMVNGQLFHEDETLAPEVTLEKIKLKSAVLRFRNYRFEVSY